MEYRRLQGFMTQRVCTGTICNCIINSAYVFHPVKDALTDYKWLLIGVNAMYLVVILTTVCICNNRARFEKK